MKKLLPVIFSLLIAFNVQAQREFYPDEEPNFLDRVYTGGYFSMQFGTFTYIDISPALGYMVTQHFSVGTGFSYRYLKYRDSNYDYSLWGWRLFARHNIGRMFFLYGEFENLQNEFLSLDGSTYKEWVSAVFFGGGIFQPLGNSRSAFVASALYNFTYDQIRSPYSSPWVFRVGFTF